ncbi:hypothetical protein GV764_10165 [Atlantibacter hermannii]|nr:hypothetical protein [Atlantibacter hermannii]NBC99385.1 hypothetical protein [Atlantibacter hermannii]
MPAVVQRPFSGAKSTKMARIALKKRLPPEQIPSAITNPELYFIDE